MFNSLGPSGQIPAITLKQKPTFQNSIWHVNPNWIENTLEEQQRPEPSQNLIKRNVV